MGSLGIKSCCNEEKSHKKDVISTVLLDVNTKSLFDELGGYDSISAVVNEFYNYILKDDRINHYFQETNMKVQRLQQSNFLCMAFGGPKKYTGKDMRTAHAHLKLTEDDFNAVAENLLKALKKFKVPEETIGKIMKIVASTHDEVLNL